MKRLYFCFLVVLLLCPQAVRASDQTVYLNAFGETATAYLNDSFLLLGTTADGFVSDIISKDTALEIAKNVQKRVRLIRAKLKAVSATRISGVDQKLVGLLDNAFACMDHQAWSLGQYLSEKTPDNAKRFEGQRTECLNRLKKIADFYTTLPPSPEVPEPLSTR
ncbi:MAG TPA: hypothetical protein VK463_05055 [Desulfomonilaceae bacterium]|nr:hypothetical protein [Desulfomonilaceae bacterium]